jgi:hypothetical protein
MVGWIIGGLFFAFVLWCLCASSGRNNRIEEKLELLNRMTLDDFVNWYIEDGVEFVINNGVVTGYIETVS